MTQGRITRGGVKRVAGWSRLSPYLLLVLLSAALFVPGQAGLPPFDRDESRYLQATTQMFEDRKSVV
jgi:4-amino-4-deoxy-L-arabinose transferase-like glycosyltransferase